MNRISYKGFVIRPAPLPLSGTSGWNTQIYISKDKDSNQHSERKFTGATTSTTEDEAIKRCIVLGKHIIDGEIDNCSLDGL